jgi:hypothetical protein
MDLRAFQRSTIAPCLLAVMLAVAACRPPARLVLLTPAPCRTCDEHEESTGSRAFLEEHAVPASRGAATGVGSVRAIARLPLVAIELFYDPGCAACRELVGDELPKLGRATGVLILTRSRDIRDPAVLEELDRRLASTGHELQAFPVAFAARDVFQGLDAVRAGLRDLPAAVASLPKQ